MFGKRWKDVLGMNARTLDYVSRANPSQAIRLANNKLETKRTLQKAGLTTPRLFAVIKSRSELKRFRWTKLPSSFVLKPNQSSGGGASLPGSENDIFASGLNIGNIAPGWASQGTLVLRFQASGGGTGGNIRSRKAFCSAAE